MTDNSQQTPPEQQDTMKAAFDQFMEHQRRAFEESGKAVDALMPDGFKEHSAVARDEFRKGLKVLVDATIDELEKLTKIEPKAEQAITGDDDDKEPPSTTGRTKVKVQVE